jgi:hypothetical protein
VPKPPELSRPSKLDVVFGLVIPGMIFGPMLLLGVVGMLVTGAGGNVPRESQDVLGILLAMSIAAVVALAALAVAVMLGPARIKQRPLLRGAVVVGLIAGIAVAAYALWAQRSSVTWATSASANAGALVLIVPGLLALGGPMVVALRHLLALVRK